MKLIWGPTYFQAVLKYYTHFFHKIHSNNSLRDKMYDGPLFSIYNKSLCIQNDQKLTTDFSIYECLHLTGAEVNFAFDIWKFLELFCLVLTLFQVWLHIHADIALLFSF